MHLADRLRALSQHRQWISNNKLTGTA